MKAKTRIFGEIEIADDKIITLEKGMIGFPDLNRFALIFDEEKQKKHNSIMWLQSMDDTDIAFPVMEPLAVKADYKPNVNEAMIAPLGQLNEENTYILVTVTVPKKVEDFSVNLKAPLIINMDTHKGVQLIVEDDYPVKYKVYQILKDQKERQVNRYVGIDKKERRSPCNQQQYRDHRAGDPRRSDQNRYLGSEGCAGIP